MEQNAVQNYTIRTSRLRRATLYGFEQNIKDGVSLMEGDSHFMILPCIDSFQERFHWGRFRLRREIPETCRMNIYAFALDAETDREREAVASLTSFFRKETNSLEEKKDVFLRSDGICMTDQENMLFYELEGRYLWIAIEVIGSGEGKIRDMKIFNPGDNFMQTFPEVYQEEGSFFHRYMSIFSTIYGDTQDKIEHMAELLDPDQAPAYLLPTLAGWLGIEAEDGYLEEEIQRKLIRRGYQLNRRKGTRWVIEELARIVLGEDVQIIESNLLEAEAGDMELYQKLYGDSHWDVTILVNQAPQERLQEQFKYLLMQFKPVRCRIHLMFHQNCNTMDSYCYLDANARLTKNRYGSLEQGNALDDGIILDK